MNDKGLQAGNRLPSHHGDSTSVDSIVLDKTIFSNVFERDIRRVYIYKKSERIAKAIQLVLPAFKDAQALKGRLQDISVRLIDGAVLSPSIAREALSRELLALSSVLAVARAGGILSSMNTDIISREAHNLLEEIAGYEEPKVSFEETPSLAALSRAPHFKTEFQTNTPRIQDRPRPLVHKGQDKGQTHKEHKNGRRDAIVSILRSKGPSFIKDISMLIREVSEKTIQRELQALVSEGKVKKTGERRWTTYTLVG